MSETPETPDTPDTDGLVTSPAVTTADPDAADPGQAQDAAVDDVPASYDDEPGLDEGFDPAAYAGEVTYDASGAAVVFDEASGEYMYAELPAGGGRRRTPQGVVQVVGRRKQAIARVRIVHGSGSVTVNGKALEVYFPSKTHQQQVRQPFVELERADAYDVVATVSGGGTSGQAGAVRLAVARGLVELEPDDRTTLKSAGLLTRDPRVKERKKYGLKKARKAPQYSKR